MTEGPLAEECRVKQMCTRRGSQRVQPGLPKALLGRHWAVSEEHEHKD